MEKFNRCLDKLILLLLFLIIVAIVLVIALTHAHAKTVVHKPKYYACYNGEKYAVYVPGKMSLPVVEKDKVVRCTGEGKI